LYFVSRKRPIEDHNLLHGTIENRPIYVGRRVRSADVEIVGQVEVDVRDISAGRNNPPLAPGRTVGHRNGIKIAVVSGSNKWLLCPHARRISNVVSNSNCQEFQLWHSVPAA
jgi:hypothetical protein